MGWLKTKRVPIKSIVLPGNFSATKAAARITKLATLVRRTGGLIHHPVVEAKTMRLLAGHDRIAAVLQLGDKHVEVRFWEGTPKEFRDTQIIENVGRRHDDDRDALIAELTREDEPQGRETEELTQPAVSRPRDTHASRQTKVAAKNADAAAAAGVSVKTVRNIKSREKAKAKEEASAAEDVSAAQNSRPDAALALPDGFNAFGLPVSTEHRERVAALATQLAAWERMTTALLTELARVEKIANPPLLSHQAVESIRDKARALGHVVREAIPTSLCFYCKNDDRSVIDCPACGATGLAGRHGGDNVPAELKLTGAAARIALDGHYVLASEAAETARVPNAVGGTTTVTKRFAEAAKKAVAKRGGVRVVAVDETGAEVDVPLPEDDGEELAF